MRDPAEGVCPFQLDDGTWAALVVIDGTAWEGYGVTAREALERLRMNLAERDGDCR